MRKRTALVCVAFLAFAAVWSTGCSKKAPTTVQEQRPTESAAPPAATSVPAPPTTAPADETQRVLSSSLEELNRKGYLQDAYFDYDKYELRDDARSALATNSEWLKRFGTIQVLIEGHCDERGTEAYNLALGERRANSAKDYLASLGIDGGRMKTVSYGKERPVCTESNEACWQKNRRAHFVITAK